MTIHRNQPFVTLFFATLLLFPTAPSQATFLEGVENQLTEYEHDANKNKLKETINAPMAGYGFNSVANAQYDDEDRLTGWTRDDNNKTQTWNLSLVGDWDTFTEAGTTPFSETRTHGATHELTNIVGGLNPGALTHDAKGNITANSNTQGYTWDFDNRLSEAVVPAGAPGTTGTHEYEYDALGRRVAKTVDALGTPATTVYVCTGQQVIAEYTSGVAAGTALRKYLYASYIDEPCLLVDRTAQGSSGAGIEEIYYYHQNNLYSVAALTDALGAVFERYAYDAYGNLAILDSLGTTVRASSLIGNPYTYTGRRFDEETENYFYRERYYNSSLGRFVSRDSIGYSGGINLFNYVYNKPLVYIDPTGEHFTAPPVVRPAPVRPPPTTPGRGGSVRPGRPNRDGHLVPQHGEYPSWYRFPHSGLRPLRPGEYPSPAHLDSAANTLGKATGIGALPGTEPTPGPKIIPPSRPLSYGIGLEDNPGRHDNPCARLGLPFNKPIAAMWPVPSPFQGPDVDSTVSVSFVAMVRLRKPWKPGAAGTDYKAKRMTKALGFPGDQAGHLIGRTLGGPNTWDSGVTKPRNHGVKLPEVLRSFISWIGGD